MGMPITGSVVWAARTPARWAALPAAAMMTPKPASLAPAEKAAAASGVLWADMTWASTGMPSLLRVKMAPFTTGRSLSLPMMTATFLLSLINDPFPFRIRCGLRQIHRSKAEYGSILAESVQKSGEALPPVPSILPFSRRILQPPQSEKAGTSPLPVQ